ncbi:hypothetical protein DF3PA_110104 [Candidatus Defluviicoccus seviourii]|uniref:Uncharacterized protein n=1 Tax=Candidatus Defluviicoccus seviourii TaxID=2565273 RepID=A0A564WA56_9PROT|nr:hypothetical protein DF3PA_110104 [Candidatus Defluviicoccus seviourii]
MPPNFLTSRGMGLNTDPELREIHARGLSLTINEPSQGRTGRIPERVACLCTSPRYWGAFRDASAAIRRIDVGVIGESQ